MASVTSAIRTKRLLGRIILLPLKSIQLLGWNGSVRNVTENCVTMSELDPTDLEIIAKMMEEMANAPREELPYKRQPGENGMYEIYNERKAKGLE